MKYYKYFSFNNKQTKEEYPIRRDFPKEGAIMSTL